ncbi:AAA family ATPase [Cobetia crustatorum]|uniref:AAA family ATPase n=1 Tax=Cobetia crustatorum TaxID=553385 RepID=UPI0004B52098|nr:AAA family ATPase [Cobetia crustatorum]
MITEISLQNTASYKTKTTLYTDKKINIIYGLNGTGKSTFSNYLHKQDDIKYNSCSNSNTSDSKIIVYNQSFIQENFYSKDTLNGIFSLSKENKDAIERVTQITLELETLDKVLVGIKKEIAEELKKSTTLKEYSQNKTWEIKANHAGGDRVLEFCLQGTMGSRATLFDYLNSIPLPNTEPAKTIIELKEEANAISGDDVTKYFPLKKFKPTNLNDSEKDLLSEIIIGSESSPVSSLILKLKNSDWVHDGLKFLDNSDGEKCPFCQSETITKQLTHDIRNYFDESYKSNIEKIKLIRDKYRSDCTNNPNIDYYKENSFTKKYILDINEQYTRLKIAEDDNLNLISEKISNPSLSIVPVDTISTIKALNSIIDIINNDITTYNNKIDNSEAELRIIKSDFWKIMRLKYDQTISNYNDSLKTINATIESKNNLYSDNERLRSKKKSRQRESSKSYC